jgi:hypothetical protein
LRACVPMLEGMSIFHSRMFVAVLLGAAAVAAWAYIRWWRSNRDAWAFSRGKPWLTLTALAEIVLMTAMCTYQHDSLEDRLSRVATGLIGAKAAVHCQSFGGSLVDASAELGFVRFGPDGVPEHSTTIKHEQCQYLQAYLDHHGRDPSANEIVAVHVLTHESMHMRGATAEAVAECQAVQRDARTARDLGASPADAPALASAYWRGDYPRMPDAYTSADCRPSGAMDEHLPDGWPKG